MAKANKQLPTIDTSTQDGLDKWRANDFNLIVDCDFSLLTSLPQPMVVNGSNPEGKDDSFKSIGKFPSRTSGLSNFVNRDIFKVEPLNDQWGNDHRKGERTADGTRDRAWSNKRYPDILSLESDNLGTYLVQGGKVIDSGDPEYSGEFAAEDNNKNFCSSWLDTFHISPPNKTPTPTAPNVTFGKNTYFEICVSFDKVRTKGFRQSLWLMPATLNGNPRDSALFHDNNPYDSERAYDHNKSNGVEIDIFEHEYSPTLENIVLMKALNDWNPALDEHTKNKYGHYNDTIDGVDSGVNKFYARYTNIVYQNINEGYHRIGFMWTDTDLIWFLNGRPVVKDDNQMPNAARMYMLLTREFGNVLASKEHVSDSDPVSPDNQALFNNDKAKVRYIKVWEMIPRSTPRAIPAIRQTEQLRGHPASESSINLRWGVTEGAAKYNIYRDGNYLDTVESVNTYTDNTGLSLGTTYSYEVEALTGDNTPSTRSHEAFVTLIGNSGSSTAPGAVGTVTGTRYSGSNGEIFWKNGSYTQFNVYRDGEKQNNSPKTGNSFYQDGLASGTTYTYEVKALQGGTEISLGKVSIPGSQGPGTPA